MVDEMAIVVVCVDDETSILSSLRNQLRRGLGSKCRIEIAESGEEALEIFADISAKGMEIPLIISDQIMPGMKGDDLLINIHRYYPKTLKILLTGQASAQAVGNAVNHANLYRYITKPWNETDLNITIKEALHLYAQDRELTEVNKKLEQLNNSLEQEVKLRTEKLEITNQELQKSREFMQRIADSTPSKVYIYDLYEQKTIYHNRKFTEILGYEADIAFTSLVHPDDQSKILNQHLKLQSSTDHEVLTVEYRMLHKNGDWKWFISQDKVFKRDPNGGVTQIIGSATDISDRKSIEAALIESQKRYQVLFNSKSDAVFIHGFTEEGFPDKFTEVNNAACKRLKYTSAELLQMTPHDLVPSTTVHNPNIINALKSDNQAVFETIHLAKDGSQFPVEITLNQFECDGKPIILAFARDISDRKLAEQALIEQAAETQRKAVEAATLGERNRIAREIHDTLAQCLTGVIVQLQAAEDNRASAEHDAHVASAAELAKMGLVEARRSVQALRPEVLTKVPLNIALAQLAQNFHNLAVEIIYEVVGTPFSLPSNIESNLLRIAQEALTNCLRHANFSEIRLALVYDTEQVSLCIQDDGCGFNPNQLTSGFGLIGIRERADEIGAKLTISSALNQGTKIVIVLSVFSSEA